MFDAQCALEKWRADLSTNARLTAEQIAELETHVLDAMDGLRAAQLSDEEKFLIATHRLGHPVHLRNEYEKITPWITWRNPIYWATVGVAWVLGVEAVMEMAVPFGGLIASRASLPSASLSAWLFVVYVGAPVITFASVAAWIHRYSSTHPTSTKALQATVASAVLLRLGSMPLLNLLNDTAWKGLAFSKNSWRSFQSLWQVAAEVGLFVVACVAAIVIARFRKSVGARSLSD